jgi:D-alanyl-D-alanine carboxypeptidase/D-alanyl-D-alanine-endopeptidase (penicillin-binding protein 4)
MLLEKVRSGRWGAMVVSLTRGDTLLSVNPGQQLQPASTMKLYTSAVALDRLGPDWQFSTDVLRDGPLGADGTVNGNLVLRGDGDPALSNRFLRGDAGAPMDLLAKFVAGAGVKRVTGDVIGDASAFDDQRIPEGWLSRYLGAGYAARVSALSLNENLVWVAAYPGEGRGTARVVLEPATTAFTLASNVRTVPGSSGGNIVVRKTTDGRVTATGWIGGRSIPRKYSFVVDDPAAFTAGAFRAALAAQGIVVDGQVRLAPAPANAVRIASLPSPPLARLVSAMNRESINHYAELLFRNAARGPRRVGVGSVETGTQTLHQFLAQKARIAPTTVTVSDGSGLSTLDSLTARSMVQLLAYANAAPWSSAFHASLPVAGESELLRHRMKYTPAQGNLHAKTGTTNSVISLGGYVTAHDGEILAFSFIYNGNDRWNAKETIDRMGATLAAFVRE